MLAHAGLEVVVGMHLSRENNLPALVRRELGRPLAGSGIRVEVADQDVPLRVEVGTRPRRRPEERCRLLARPRSGGKELVMLVEARIKLKNEVLDPQGEAIRRVLAGLGYEEVQQVRVGKLMLLEVAGDDPEKVQRARRGRPAASCSPTR